MFAKGKQHVEIFVFISHSKTTHIASFYFLTDASVRPKKPKSHSLLSLLPHSTTTLFCMRAATADLLSSL